MPFSILTKVAFRSLVANKRVFFPYFIAIIALFSLEYILFSLTQNEYVMEFHSALHSLLAIGVFFTTALIFIITLYTSNFVQKNQTKEFGLYSILGLEKVHISFVMIVQHIFTWVVTSIFSVVVGYLLGSLVFIALNRMMLDTGASLMNYPFQMNTAIWVVILIFCALFISFLFNVVKLIRLNPINFLNSVHQNEGEPKGRIWMTIIGLLALGGGYYIALTTADVLSALLNIFIAIFLVMIGTYLLFNSLSIIVLKGMKKNKKIYYKPNHFLSISGMLARMNNNAVSLASIAILSSGVILVLGVTLSLYRVMETQVSNVMPAEYSVQRFSDDNSSDVDYLEDTLSELSNYGEPERAIIHNYVYTNGHLSDQSLIPTHEAGSDMSNLPIVVLGETVETYNEMHGGTLEIDDSEVLVTSNMLSLDDLTSLEINGKTFDTKVVPEDPISSNYGVEVLYLAFADQEILDGFRNYFQLYNTSESAYYAPTYTSILYFDVAGDATGIDEYLTATENQEPIRVNRVEDMRQNMYGAYGGLLFIGIVVSIVLIIGTILMLYFKQISEGYQDRDNYRIMQQVGLPDDMIKKTIRSQISWVFLLPIGVAVMHNLFASKIMYTLVGLFGTRDIFIFASSYAVVIVAFVIVYLLFYWLTSRTYYNIIDEYSL